MTEKEDSFERETYLTWKVSDALKEEDATLTEAGEVFGILWTTYCVAMGFNNNELSKLFDDMIYVIVKERDRERREHKNDNHNATRRGRWKFSSEGTDGVNRES